MFELDGLRSAIISVSTLRQSRSNHQGLFKISEMFARLHQEAGELGGVGAVIVDTSAAFFEGGEENDNVQLGNHARMLRKLTELPGEPGVAVDVIRQRAAAPAAEKKRLIRRGVDGNLTAKKISDEVVELHWCGKYRGPGFEPVLFELSTIKSERVRDARGG